MIYGLLAALVVVIITNAWLADRKDRRAHEERQGDRLERAAMAQRIQAPEQAVIDHSIAAAPASLPAVDTNDDHDFWQAEEERQRALAKLEAYESRLA